MKKNNYLLSGSYDGDRLQLEREIRLERFEQLMNRILDEYGLLERLQRAKVAGQKAFILDVGCGEGLVLHDVAHLLEKSGVLEATILAGLDINPASLSVADDYSKVSKPPRPYLHFYRYDATQPLEESDGLRALGATRFDFIYLLNTLEHLPNARSHLARYYNYLAPGGVIYLRDHVTHKGKDGWLPFHPAMELYPAFGFGYTASINPGVAVGLESADWLRELGAEKVAAQLDIVPVGGETKLGMLMLRNTLMIFPGFVPRLISMGRLTQAQHDANMQTILRETTPQHCGQISYVDTLARHP